METRRQIVTGRKAGQELIILDAAGAELARVHVTGAHATIAVSAPAPFQVVRGEVAARWQAQKPGAEVAP